MEKSLTTVTLLLGMAMMTPMVANAQDKVEASVGADIVSGYIWRGQDLGNVSIQPSLGVSYKGLSLSAWGSVGISNLSGGEEQTKEFDLTLGYTTGGLNVGVTDYWFTGGPGYLKYGAHNTTHVFEATVGYDFGIAAINWFTNFAGDDYKTDGDRAYSSYVEASAPFQLGGLDFMASIGATPVKSSAVYGDTSGFSVIDISLGASKEIKITENYSVPIFAKITMNPKTEGTYFVFGVSF